MNEGSINNNTDYSGVVLRNNAVFTMKNGSIRNNTSIDTFGGGGGVNLRSNSSFSMEGGTISGNTARFAGGGVGMDYSATGIFNKTGGIIYGYTEGDDNSNVVRNSSGVVVNDMGHAAAALTLQNSNIIVLVKKETTAGENDNLYINRSVTPPVVSGAWDMRTVIEVHPGMTEWNLIPETAVADPNQDTVFTVAEVIDIQTGLPIPLISYRWFLDGDLLTGETGYSYIFNQPSGVYELVVSVTAVVNGVNVNRSGRCRISVP